MRKPNLRLIRHLTAAACAIGVAGAAGCSDATFDPAPVTELNPLASGADFVAIPRQLDAASSARRSASARALPPADTGEAFYLAIRRSSLEQRWFLSAFLKQYFPRGPAYNGAGRSLGTRVVSFRIQNNKLFMFDAADGHATSSVFDPEVLIESYPIVANVPGFTGLRGASDYVLVDPAAGLNRFSVLGDTLAPTLPHEGIGAPNRFQVDLSYLQRFRSLADGATYEQVFTGYAELPVNEGPLDPNIFQLSGTLAISLRHYAEGDGFAPVAAAAKAFYFVGPPQLDGHGGVAPRHAQHFNVHPGMQPIPWLISPALVDYVAAHPELAAVDVVGAVKEGIESWNDAFGFPVLAAQVAAPTDSFADDDRNYLIFDPSPALGYAFASSRANPNTGETRGATVLFGAAWLDPSGFKDDPGATTGLTLPPAPAAAPALLGWDAMPDASLCELRADEAIATEATVAAGALTAPAKMHAFLAHTIAHEIGHTLGLRHNFKGSLVPPTSSIMDYTNQADSIARAAAGPYDVDALRYLYGLSTELPAQPFCGDDDLKSDPSCQMFDHGADPIADTYSRKWSSYWNYVLSTGNLHVDDAFDFYGHGLMAYVRAGVGSEPQRAYDLLTHLVRPPIAANLAQIPSFGAGADFLSRALFNSLYGTATNQYSRVLSLPTDPAVLASLLADLRGNLLNVDGIRSFETRRLCVDILKKLQSVDAYQALLDAHDALAARLAALVADGQSQVELALTRDLLARVDRATTPYFQ